MISLTSLTGSDLGKSFMARKFPVVIDFARVNVIVELGSDGRDEQRNAGNNYYMNAIPN